MTRTIDVSEDTQAPRVSDMDEGTFHNLLNSMMFQAMLSMRFGGGQKPEFSFQPGMASSALYDYGGSEMDPMGQSYYGQDQSQGPINPWKMQGNLKFATDLLNRFRLQQPLQIGSINSPMRIR